MELERYAGSDRGIEFVARKGDKVDTSPGRIERVKTVLDDYRNTGNPDLLRELRGYIFEYKDYEGDDSVILDLKKTFNA